MKEEVYCPQKTIVIEDGIDHYYNTMTKHKSLWQNKLTWFCDKHKQSKGGKEKNPELQI